MAKTEILKGIGGGCDEAAEYAVKHTKFSPGKQRGKPVKVKVMVPVVFKLEVARHKIPLIVLEERSCRNGQLLNFVAL